MKKILTLLALGLAGTVQAQVTNSAPYCDATFDDPMFNIPGAIKSVTLGTLTNNSGGQYAAPHYVHYNNLAAPSLMAGSSMSASFVFNVPGTTVGGWGWGVWIDFDQSNTFEASEQVAGSTGTTYLVGGSLTTMGPSLVIPTTATNGNTRMRVRMVKDDAYSAANGAAILPCNASTSAADVMDYGETEDYTVTITGGTGTGGGTGGGGGTTPPPNPNGLDFSSNRTTGFINTNFTLSDNDFKNPTTRRWEFIPNNVIYQAATTSASQRPIVRFTNTGTYSVKLVTSYTTGGGDSAQRTSYIRINPFPAGVAQVENVDFSLFPNPATGGFVNFTQPLQGALVDISDITGVVVYQNARFSGTQLNLSGLAAGVYFLRITQAGETFTQKLVVAK